jgi:sugar O-acyltransferase (sialic acid O-acetyltransferase NeuD family)
MLAMLGMLRWKNLKEIPVNKLLIVGAGGHGRVLADTATAMGKWDDIAFLDDRYQVLSGTLSYPVVGAFDQATKYLPKYRDLVIAIGDNRLRLELLDGYTNDGFNIPILIQPGALVSPSATIGAGSVLLGLAAVNVAVTIGRGCIINTSATIDHDCVIGDGVHICPGVNLGGEVKVGQLSLIGIGACVIQQISIGEEVIVGAGTVVISDVEDEICVVGVPARKIKINEFNDGG